MSTDRPVPRLASVLIVDDHPMVRDALANALGKDGRIKVLGSVSNAAEALDFLSRRRVDVVLLDHRLPDKSGLDVMAELSARAGSVPAVVMMSAFDDAVLMEAALKAGASAFVDKSTPMSRLAFIVVSVAHGPTPSLTGDRVSLTNRERNVLTLVAEGMSNRDVAECLGISDETVKTHLDKVYAKLGVRDRAGAVARSLRLGLLPEN